MSRKICDCREHRRLALEAAHQSIILLKNSKKLLPLKNIRSIAVIGPNANEIRLGGYSGYGMKVVTPLEGIKERAPKNTKIYFAEGCKITSRSKGGFKKAINLTQESDVAVMVMGNIPIGERGERRATEGENRDRCNLDLPGMQEELIKEVCDTGKPVIVVLINGSAITMSKWVNEVDAILEACREELEQVLEGWIFFRIYRNLSWT